jgi:uncharacterized membrane protein
MRNPFITAKATLADYWIRLQSSYWFVPSLMTAVSVLLAAGMVAIDELMPEGFAGLGWITANEPEGARAVLATIAGSMITVASVTFSMTLLMMSYASAQIGPRVVPRFLRDRGNQVVLGTFISTFIYCLIVLRTVRSASDAQLAAASAMPFIPHLAILVSLVLALLSVAVLIYFLHHVPARLNVSNVVGLLGDELLRRLEQQFPPRDECVEPLEWRVARDCAEVLRLRGTGCYLRIVDDGALVSLAQRTDRAFETLVVPGNFCVPGEALVRIFGGKLDDEAERTLRQAFSWGADRTPDQDILLLIDQLAEIAGKALSTGVNNQFTALLCIDQMERALCAAAERREPDAIRAAGGVARVLRKHVSRAEMADRFLVPLRQYTLGDYLATDRLLAMLTKALARQTPGTDLHSALRRHADAIQSDAERALPSGSLRASFAARSNRRRDSSLVRRSTESA